MAEKLDWMELQGNGTDEPALLLKKQLAELQWSVNDLRPWWHKGASWFVAFCLANAAAIWWAGELGIIARDLGSIAVIAVLVFFASFAGAVQSARARSD